MHLQPHPAHHVLPEIKRVGARPRLGHRTRRQLIGDARGFRVRRLDDKLRRRLLRIPGPQPRCHGLPRRIIEAGPRPAVAPQPRIIFATLHQVRVPDRPPRRPPRGVARDDLARAVGINDLELRQQPRIAAVVIAPAGVAQHARIPSVAEDRAERVFTAAHLRGDIVGLVLDPRSKIRPARREIVASHPRPVQLQLIGAECGAENRRPPHRLCDGEALAQQRRRWQPVRQCLRRAIPGIPLPRWRDQRFPLAVVIAALVPACVRRGRELPARVDCHDLRAAVRELQLHLAERRGLIAVALRDFQSDHVFPGRQQQSHIDRRDLLPARHGSRGPAVDRDCAHLVGGEDERGAGKLAPARPGERSADIRRERSGF